MVVALGIAFAILLRPNPPVWLDTSGDLIVLRNRATQGDAALHLGTFTIGSDACLYVTVRDDYGSKVYLAAVQENVLVDRTSIRQGLVSFRIGGEATFARAEVPGEVPKNVFDLCVGAREVYSVELAR